MIAHAQHLQIDCSLVKKSNTVLFLLFLRWVRLAKAKGLTLELCGASQNIRAMSEVLGLDDLLPFVE